MLSAKDLETMGIGIQSGYQTPTLDRWAKGGINGLRNGII
jgi:hypothetical protein